MKTIRDLFLERRPIDRRIEKVIDYYADDEGRLAAEIEEYEATDNVEDNFRKFLDVYQTGVTTGEVTEVGIWVSGFYGSGKSSFTKYLGFALDPERTVQERPFLDLLADRLRSTDVRAQLRTVAKNVPTAVVMLDLGAEQLAESATITVSNILYWKVLQLVGYSKEKKLAQLEFTLDRRGLYDDFRQRYQQEFGREWEDIHNDPLIGVATASRLLPHFLPEEFPEPDSFSQLRFELAEDQRSQVRRMIDLVRRHTGRENILFLVDEAGQYVAPRGELILNLDGLARNLKELGQGRVWIVATGQQTLSEIVEKAAYNSTELNKLRDRFPIGIELDARDIREITYRRLLTKSDSGEKQLRDLFRSSGQAMLTHTRLTGTTLFKDDPAENEFVRYYPFLPQHFSVLMELIRRLASATGGIGLRSAIRVIQDVLVDTSRILPVGEVRLADQPVGTLATVDDFYKTLRNDINKYFPHVVSAVDRVSQTYPEGDIHRRVAQAVAALQPLEEFPRTAENIAALLYPTLGSPALLESVRQALADLVESKEVGLIDDPQTGGYRFLSESVTPLQKQRTNYVPSGGEVSRVRNQLLKALLEPQPKTRLEGTRDVSAAVRAGRIPLLGDQEEVEIRLEIVPGQSWNERRDEWLKETAQRTEFQNVVVWLFSQDDVAEDILPEVSKSEWVAGQIDERSADKDVAQYIRAERRRAQRHRDEVKVKLRDTLLAGTFIFRGKPTPVGQSGTSVELAARTILGEAARQVFHQYHLVTIRPSTNLATQFLEVERLDRMPPDRDPLGLVTKKGGAPRVDLNHPALAETLRVFREKVEESGSRLTGKAIQDLFADAPYGWSKDATRYLFAALLVAGEIELHTGGEILKTAGPAASEAMKNTVAFNKVAVGLRGSRPDMDTLDRAARRLEELFGEQILPLEDHISKGARKHLPLVVEQVGSLPDRLRLLHLPGEGRARELLSQLTEILRGDASDAPARLGPKTTELVDDIAWARAAVRALDDGGESDVNAARAFLSGLADIQQMFPYQQLAVTNGEVAAVQEILGSTRFHEQLADLRTHMRHLGDHLEQQYQAAWESYETQLHAAKLALEQMPEWELLTDEDRNEIAGELALTLPQNPQKNGTLTYYKTLLARSSGLSHLQQQLREKVLARVPNSDGGTIIHDGDGEDGGEVEIASVKLGPLVEIQEIASPAELENWLATIRQLILGQLNAGRRVKLEL